MKLQSWKSIVNKVRLSILGTAIVAVTIAGTFVIVSEYFINRESFVDTVISLGDVVAFNLRAPIVFDDQREARDTLDSLATVPSIQASLVIDNAGGLVATYANPAGETSSVLREYAEAVLAADDTLMALQGRRMIHARPILLDGDSIGALAIEASLEEIYALMRVQLVALIVILAIAILVAFLAGSAMQRFITTPVQALVKAMKDISMSKTFEVRVERRSEDEIGVLVDGFNEMLEEINARDRKLAEANSHLERQVSERTQELEHANSVLSKTLSEVERAKEAAEEANQAKGAFLATMSHEIRTPINGMLGNTELLLNEPLTDKARLYGEIAYRSGEALLDIINDILDFSRIEAGKLEIMEAEFNLGRLVEELALSLGPQIRQKGLEFIVDCAEAPENLVVGDQGRLRQILSNLITNAMKFTEKGSISVALSSQYRNDGTVVARFDIRDTGIGISTEDQRMIFERFAQVDDSESRAYGGTGLGLAICQELVRRMGGNIGVKSERGKGAHFWFTILLGNSGRSASPDLGAPEIAGQQLDAGAAERESVSCRVLVVDDNEINRDMAMHMLQRSGCKVDVVTNGQEAVDRVSCADYDLVLMDCQMPIMDGFRATRRIRGIEAECRKQPTFIVALTANAIKGDRDRCLQAGMNDYISKPFKLADIEQIVETALSARPEPGQTGAAADTADVLDPEALNNILRLDDNGSEDLIARYIDIFLRSAPSLLRTIGESIEQAEAEELTFAAHSLKSDSLSVGASRLGELARFLEERGRDKDFSGTAELLSNAHEEFDRVKSALATLKAG